MARMYMCTSDWDGHAAFLRGFGPRLGTVRLVGRSDCPSIGTYASLDWDFVLPSCGFQRV